MAAAVAIWGVGMLASTAATATLGTGIVGSIASSIASRYAKRAFSEAIAPDAKIEVPLHLFTDNHPGGLSAEEAAERYSTSFALNLLGRRAGHSGMIGASTSTEDGMPYSKYWDLAAPFASAAPSQGIADSITEFQDSIESTEQFQQWAGMKLQEPEMFGENHGNVAGYNGAINNPDNSNESGDYIFIPEQDTPYISKNTSFLPSIEDLEQYDTAQEYFDGEGKRIAGDKYFDAYKEYPEWASDVVNDYIIFQEAYLKQGGNYLHDEDYHDRLSELGYSRDEDFWDGNGNETTGNDFMADEGRRVEQAAASSSSDIDGYGLFSDALSGIATMMDVSGFGEVTGSVGDEGDIISDGFDTNLMSDNMMDNSSSAINWDDYASDYNVQHLKSAGGEATAAGYIQQQASWNKIINNQNKIIGISSI